MPKSPVYSEPSYFCIFNSLSLPLQRSLEPKFQPQELAGKNPKNKQLYIRGKKKKKENSLDFRSLMRLRKLAGKYNMKQWIPET